jgi:DNA invertase Pin-like site-specific DNA recombinase
MSSSTDEPRSVYAVLDAAKSRADERLVVVYERVSSEKQNISRQCVVREDACRDHPDAELVVIQDDGVSAFKVSIFDRPGGRRLCELVEAGRVEAIYADAQDRLSRGDDVEWVTFRAMCETNGTRIVIDGRELRTDLGGRLEGYLKNLLARQEQIEKGRRVAGGKRRRREKGLRAGGPRPFGYTQADGELTPVPHEFEALRRMRGMVLQGATRKAIAVALNDDGVRTVTGARWSDTRITQMLKNPLYAGQIKDRDRLHQGHHTPVFSEAEWAALQAALAVKSRLPGGGKGRPTKGTHLFPGGVVRCGCCGGSIVPRTTTNEQGRVYERYRCWGQHSGSASDCPMPSIARDVLDGAVLRYFEQVALDVDQTREHLAAQTGRLLNEHRALLSDAERQVSLASERLARVRRDYQDGKLDADPERNAAEWREFRDGLTAERDAALAQAERQQARLAQAEADLAFLDAEQSTLRFLSEVRAAVAGSIGNAHTVAAARQALLSSFDGFTLHAAAHVPDTAPALPKGWVRSQLYFHPELLPPGGFIIEPHPRRDVICDDVQEVAFPLLARVGLVAPETNRAPGR